MKKLLIVGLLVGFATSGFARYWVYPVKMSGSALELREGKGVFNEDGVKTTTDLYAKTAVRLTGYLVEDEVLDAYIFVYVDKGEYEQWDATLETDFDHINYVSISDNVNLRTGNGTAKFIMKGVSSDRVTITAPGMEIEAVVISKLKLNATLKVVNFEAAGETVVMRMNGSGSAIVSLDGEADAFGKNVKVMFNQKLSEAMGAAYEEAGGSGNEAVAKLAAAAVLNEFINTIAKIDNADVTLPGAL